jgi:hypothetical protein
LRQIQKGYISTKRIGGLVLTLAGLKKNNPRSFPQKQQNCGKFCTGILNPTNFPAKICRNVANLRENFKSDIYFLAKKGGTVACL